MHVDLRTGVPVLSVTVRTAGTPAASRPVSPTPGATMKTVSELRLVGATQLDPASCQAERASAGHTTTTSSHGGAKGLVYHSEGAGIVAMGPRLVQLPNPMEGPRKAKESFRTGVTRAEIVRGATEHSHKAEQALLGVLNKLNTCAEGSSSCDLEPHMATVEALLAMDATGNSALLLGDLLRRGALASHHVGASLLDALAARQGPPEQAVLTELLVSPALPLRMRVHHIASKFLAVRRPTLPAVLALESLHRTLSSHPLGAVVLSVLGAVASRVPHGNEVRARLLGTIEAALQRVEGSEDQDYLASALAALGNSHPTSQHIPLIRRFTQPTMPSRMRLQGVLALRHTPHGAVDDLLADLASSDHDDQVRGAAIRMLGSRHSSEAVMALLAVHQKRARLSPPVARVLDQVLQQRHEDTRLLAISAPTEFISRMSHTDTKLSPAKAHSLCPSVGEHAAGFCQEAKLHTVSGSGHTHGMLQLQHAARVDYEPRQEGAAQLLMQRERAAVRSLGSIMQGIEAMGLDSPNSQLDSQLGQASQALKAAEALVENAAAATKDAVAEAKTPWNATLQTEAVAQMQLLGGQQDAILLSVQSMHRHQASTVIQPYLLVYGMQLHIATLHASSGAAAPSRGPEETFHPCGAMSSTLLFPALHPNTQFSEHGSLSKPSAAGLQDDSQLRGVWRDANAVQPPDAVWSHSQEVAAHPDARLHVTHTVRLALHSMAGSCSSMPGTRAVAIKPSIQASAQLRGEVQLLQGGSGPVSPAPQWMSTELGLGLLNTKASAGATFPEKFLAHSCPQGAGSVAAHLASKPSPGRVSVAHPSQLSAAVSPVAPCWPSSPVVQCAVGHCTPSWALTTAQSALVELPGGAMSPLAKLLAIRFLSTESQDERLRCLKTLRGTLGAQAHSFRALAVLLSAGKAAPGAVPPQLQALAHAAALLQDPAGGSSFRFKAPSKAVLDQLAHLIQEKRKDTQSEEAEQASLEPALSASMEALAGWGSILAQRLRERPGKPRESHLLGQQVEAGATQARQMAQEAREGSSAACPVQRVHHSSDFMAVCRKEGASLMQATERCVPRRNSGLMSGTGIWGGEAHRCDSIACGQDKQVCSEGEHTQQCVEGACRACPAGDLLEHEVHSCAPVCEEAKSQCSSKKVCTPQCSHVAGACRTQLQCSGAPSPQLGSAAAMQLVMAVPHSAAPAGSPAGLSSQDVARWKWVGDTLRKEAAILGVEEDQASTGAGGRALLAEGPPRVVQEAAAGPAALLVLHAVVTRDAFLCADGEKGSAIEMVGQTCGPRNELIRWAGFRQMGNARSTNKLCGLPGATPAVAEYQAACGVAPMRLPHLPTKVCSGGSTQACLEPARLVQNCVTECKSPPKEKSECRVGCKMVKECTSSCAKEGRTCKMNSHRGCKADSSGSSFVSLPRTEEEVLCKTVPFGKCSWKQCKRGTKDLQPFWFGMPAWKGKGDRQVGSPQECIQ